MHISKFMANKIAAWEGNELTAYYCPAGVLTIGIGHTSAAGSPKVVPGMIITKEESIEIFRRDIRSFERGVLKLLKRKPTQGQFDAFVSLAHNIGLGAFGKSTALRRFNAGNELGAAEAITWFNKSRGRVLKGLVRRREGERARFLDGFADKQYSQNEYREKAQGGEQKPITKSKTAGAGAAGAILGGITLWSQIKEGVPEVVSGMAPVFIIGAIAVCVFIVWNRKREADKGEH